MSFSLFWELLFSIPKTLYFNFRVLSWKKAIKLPILISRQIKIDAVDGMIILPDHYYPGMIKIGFSGSYNLGGRGYYSNSGTIVFHGKASLSRGLQLCVGRMGVIEFGIDFKCNSNCIINAGKMIRFGDDCLLSWNISILDGDGHKVIEKKPNNRNPKDSSIIIGDHVWICSNALILKGAQIGDGSIVSANSVISKNLSEKNVIIGHVNQVVKHDIEWII